MSAVLPDLDPASVVARLAAHKRTLLFGPPGIGKSTLAAELGAVFERQKQTCFCVNADPGSPAFGVPGALCLGRWTANGWACTDLEPLCSLDAGRFRLPLIQALHRLMIRAPQGVILIDGPGVVRGAAAAELLAGIVESARIDAVLLLERLGEPPTLENEFRASGIQILKVRPAAEARRPAQRARDRKRTSLWDRYLEQASECLLDLDFMTCIGTPPPRDVPSAWSGRQIALISAQSCVAFGEALELDRNRLRARLCGNFSRVQTLLVRDAQRDAKGLLTTAAPFQEIVPRSIPPDMSGANASPIGRSHQGMVAHTRLPKEPRPVAARVGSATAMLINGIFGDPLLHVRLQHQKRSLLFDIGETTRLPARIAHQVTDVFVSHCHIDHIAGFLWLLRSRIGKLPACRLYGPPGLAGNIAGFIAGIHWDRVGERAPQFEVSELDEDKIRRYRIRAGERRLEIFGEESEPEGILLRDLAFQVRATTLDHRTPVLAFALEMSMEMNVRKDRLTALKLTSGLWLNQLKACIGAGERETLIVLPNGTTRAAESLAAEILIVRPGQKLAYATDLADTAQNRIRLGALATGAHTFFCEAAFCGEDIEQSVRTGHLTARACGEIATAAHVERLIPFHFSRRYESEPERVYAEVRAACSHTIVPRQMRMSI